MSLIRCDSHTFVFVLGIDLTGATGIWMTAKSALADVDPGVFQKTLSDGVTVLDDVTGTISVDLEPADTEDLTGPRDRLYYDVQVLDVDDKISTPQRGRLVVKADVTTTIVAGS
jgi:hypothetical protein